MSDYISLAIRTASTICDPAIHNDVLHAAIGIVGEVYELRTAKTFVNRHEELGDICWYVALFLNTIDHRFDFPSVKPNTDASIDTIESTAHALLNDVKRVFAYNKKIHHSVFVEHLRSIIADVIGMCQIGFEHLLFTNIEKLRIRYPDKYSDEHADERDLSAEYTLLNDMACKL